MTQSYTPIISVIVPIYNAEKHLFKCIHSILSQCYQNFELILVNDGSTDDSLQICNAFLERDARIKVFHKKNGGVSSSRNLGLENAKGDYIAFVDADDAIDKSYLEILLKGIIQSCDISLCGYETITDNRIIDKQSFHFFEEKDIKISLKESYKFVYNSSILTVPFSKLFKRSIINTNNIIFDESLSIGEDMLFVLSYLFFVENVFISKNTLYLKDGTDSGSLSKKINLDQRLRYIYEAKEKHLALARLLNEDFMVEKILCFEAFLLMGVYWQMHIASNFTRKNRRDFLSNHIGYKRMKYLFGIKSKILKICFRLRIITLYDLLFSFYLLLKRK